MSLLPLKRGLLKEEDYIKQINQLYEALRWVSPIVNDKVGQVEPSADYRFDGLLAYADGTNWNPNSEGKGFYRWNTTTSAWVRIG